MLATRVRRAGEGTLRRLARPHDDEAAPTQMPGLRAEDDGDRRQYPGRGGRLGLPLLPHALHARADAPPGHAPLGRGPAAWPAWSADLALIVAVVARCLYDTDLLLVCQE